MIGTTELLLLGGLALLVFGGKKVPEMMRGLGQGVKEFKKGMQEETPTDDKEKDNSKEESVNEPSSQENNTTSNAKQ